MKGRGNWMNALANLEESWRFLDGIREGTLSVEEERKRVERTRRLRRKCAEMGVEP
jgi:peptide deformylase